MLLVRIVANVIPVDPSKGFADGMRRAGEVRLAVGELIMLMAGVLGWKTPPQRGREEGASRRACGILTASFGALFIANAWSLAAQRLPSGEMNHHGASASAMMVPLILMGCLVPVAEELLFRGFAQRTLQESGLSSLTAIGVPALLFGLIHGTPSMMLIASILGYWLGYVYYASGSLWAAIVGHAVVNVWGLLQPPSMAKGSAGWLATGLLGVAAVCAVLRLRDACAAPIVRHQAK